MLFIYLQLLDGFGAKQPKCLLSSCYSSAYWDQVSYTTDRQQHRRITFASNPPQGQLDQSLPLKIKTVLLSDGACAPGKLLLFLMPFEIRRTRDLSMKWMCIFKKGGGVLVGLSDEAGWRIFYDFFFITLGFRQMKLHVNVLKRLQVYVKHTAFPVLSLIQMWKHVDLKTTYYEAWLSFRSDLPLFPLKNIPPFGTRFRIKPQLTHRN